MLDKYLPVVAFVLFGFLGILYLQIEPSQPTYSDSLTFSNTASWDKDYFALLNEKTHYPEELFTTIQLPPPPRNSSAETAKELQTLLSYRDLRSTEEIRDIRLEANNDTVYIAGYTLLDYRGGKKFPATAALLKDSFQDLEALLMRYKQRFDRVRPSVLEPSLETVIEIPGHPAYPSGHSTQAHFIAYLFGELAPSRKTEFIARADQIALNRVIAGLHYPSDSAAGVLLAQQYFDILMRNEEFLTLLAAAKQEWAMHPELVEAPANP